MERDPDLAEILADLPKRDIASDLVAHMPS
jgi:hypothetical protein